MRIDEMNNFLKILTKRVRVFDAMLHKLNPQAEMFGDFIYI